MITRDGYSKDPNIVPIGIAITWGKEHVEEGGGLEKFIRLFKRSCARTDGGYWLQRCKNKPSIDVAYVYIIYDGKVLFRCNYIGHDSGEIDVTRPNGKKETISWPRVMCTGPVIDAPFELKKPGFQGFRYTDHLF